MTCPRCRSTVVQLIAWGNGIEADTGYRDAGEMVKCMDCGEWDYIEDASAWREAECHGDLSIALFGPEAK